MAEPEPHNEQLRTWSMYSINDYCYWTKTIKRIIITFIIVGLLPAFILCNQCDTSLDARDLGAGNKHLNRVDEGWGYYCNACNIYYSLRANTVFANSKKSLKNWVTVIFHISRESDKLADVIAKDVEQDNGWKKRRVYPVIWFIRNCLAKYFNDHLPLLGQGGKRVQIDESAHSRKHKHNVGWIITSTRWVFGMYEEETGWRKFVYVPDRSRATLLPIIQYYIARGGTIISDGWMAYHALSLHGYVHWTVNHAMEFFNRVTGFHTNNIEACWKWTKNACLSKGGCLDDALQLMLDVYSFRAMFIKKGNREKNAFEIICKAISETHTSFRISDFN